MESMLGLMELLVVLAFGLGWAVLELYTLRLDKRRAQHARDSNAEDGAAQSPRG